MRGWTLIGWAMVIFVGGLLFMLTYEVQDLQRDLAEVRQRIAHDQERIQVLEAEWSYLNQPKRLRELAKSELGLVPITPAQIMSWEEFEQRRTR